ncbi:hypothetical protein IWT25_02176 [Secundilactobacillus pentosiphilus]|uniref:Uncharacterized protein n=1 Tax=Secundilactobacillus pentosiphilus TaxID=1714682 RepID=A0A1Z5IYT8_9LACO|nr:hypothetical protein [Secundilactobacillus pentosiphilus]GAX06829.1 hypothetical protein IWT25_02176 [Secundilactobacillus pentosiphilus]
MKVTIIGWSKWNHDWHKAVNEGWACQIIGCKRWQLEQAMIDQQHLKGWEVRKAREERSNV